MAMQEESHFPAPHSAKVVGNAFVAQYYQILRQSPELVHKFYQDSSLLSRPDSNGVMTTVTTMQAIDDKILSLKYEDYTTEIKTADAQESYEKGVIVLVTGYLTGKDNAIDDKILSLKYEDYTTEIKTADCQESYEKGVIVLVTGYLTGKDNVRKKFAQTFFLAPQDTGYFVLNDVFRYVEERQSLQINSASVKGINGNGHKTTPELEPTHSPDHLVVDAETSFEQENPNNGAEVCTPLDDAEGSVIEEEVVEPPTHSSQDEILTGADSTPAAQDDAPKKSYASIVKVMKGNPVSSPVYVPSTVRAAPVNTDQQSLGSAKPAPILEESAPCSDTAPEHTIIQEKAEGYSIFVRNLPFDATDALLEEEFKKFGPIKHNGIQVRSNKGSCFGFVEFETSSSVHSALEASPITIGDRRAVIEEKRTNTRVGSSGRGRYSSGRGGFRNDSFRVRGNFGGGRGYDRNEFRHGEFSGRPRGTSGRNGEGYQWVHQNDGSGRGGRQGGGVNRNSVPA